MSALNSFAEEIAKGGISNFELSDKRFTILKRKNFLFIANSSKKVKHKRIGEELELIVERFFDRFEKIIPSWNGEVSVFYGFEKEIENSLEETVQKFQKAFW